MLREDQHRVRHIIDAAREALSFADGKVREDLDDDRMLVLSIWKSIEIVGEAAANLTNDFKVSVADIPWRNIIGMRNRLIHAYFDVDLDRLWDTVQQDLLPLIAALEAVGGTPHQSTGSDCVSTPDPS